MKWLTAITGLLAALFLILSVTSVLLLQRQERALTKETFDETGIASMQLRVHYESLMEALALFDASASEDRADTVILRFDILYERLESLPSRPAYKNLLDERSLELNEKLRASLETLLPRIDGAATGDQALLRGLHAEILPLRRDVETLALRPVQRASSVRSDIQAETKYVANLLNATVIGFVLCGGLFLLVIWRQYATLRRREADLKESEERLGLAVGQLSIWDWNLETNAFYISPTLATHLGYSTEDLHLATYEDMIALMHPEDVALSQESFAKHLDDPTSEFRCEHRLQSKSGEYRWFLAIGQAVTNAQGKAIRSSGVLTDISDRVALEQALSHSQKMEAMGQLTGGVAHDFNNILAVILGNFELIEDETDLEKIRDYAGLGSKSAMRGASLTQSLLSFARKSQVQPVELNLNEVVAESEALWARVLPENISVSLNLAESLWPTTVDLGLTQNALLNLVLNARDAMSEGGEIKITTWNADFPEGGDDWEGDQIKAGSFVALSVQDNGPGIPQETLQQIFEPFFTTKPTGAGSGLGLSMVQGFLQQSGGWVCARSVPGQGAQFNLYFPKSIGDAEGSASGDASPETTPSNHEPEDMRILLVEDEPGVLKVLKSTLSQAGLRYAAAASGDAAAKLWAEDQNFSLLITDVVMPGHLQGPQLARVLRQSTPDLPVIFLTGYAPDLLDLDDDGEATNIVLMKPTNRKDLLAQIQKCRTSEPA